MKFKEMETVDKVGFIVIAGGCGAMTFTVLLQFIRALLNS
jgi:hypothetical protein